MDDTKIRTSDLQAPHSASAVKWILYPPSDRLVASKSGYLDSGTVRIFSVRLRIMHGYTDTSQVFFLRFLRNDLMAISFNQNFAASQLRVPVSFHIKCMKYTVIDTMMMNIAKFIL